MMDASARTFFKKQVSLVSFSFGEQTSLHLERLHLYRSLGIFLVYIIYFAIRCELIASMWPLNLDHGWMIFRRHLKVN